MTLTKRDIIIGAASTILATILVFAITTPTTTNTSIMTPVTISTPTNSIPAVTNVVTMAKTSVTHFKVTNSRVVELNDEVNPTTALQTINRLKELDNGQPVYLLLNSPGGSVFDGAQIISQMEAMKSPVYTVCTQLCASMAAFIEEHGTKRYALNRAALMFHPAAGAVGGQLNNMESRVGFLSRYVSKFNNYIIARSGMNPEEYYKYLAYEFWVDSEDALHKGLLDGIVTLDGYSAKPLTELPPTEKTTRPITGFTL